MPANNRCVCDGKVRIWTIEKGGNEHDEIRKRQDDEAEDESCKVEA